MPRTVVRKTSMALWDVNTMEAALKAVAEGQPIRKVSKIYKIPFSSIRDRIRMGKCYGPAIGRKCVFTEEQEEEFAQYVVSLGAIFFDVSCNEIRRLAFEYAEQNDIPNNFSKRDNKAGKDWLTGFLKRHPTVVPRKPDFTSPHKIKGLKRDDVSRFFTNLDAALKQHKYGAKMIYCMDEIDGNYLFPSQVNARPGSSSSGGEQHNLCISANATGDYLLPFFANEQLSSDTFSTWLRQFVDHTRCSDENPVLLILDNDSVHISLASHLFCKENGIHLVSIPPRTSHKLQPLCAGFFKQLKAAFTEELDTFISKSQKVTSYDLIDMFNDAFAKVSRPEIIALGFKKTGIWPFNRDIFPDGDFRKDDEDEDIPFLNADTIEITGNMMTVDVDADADLMEVNPEDVAKELAADQSASKEVLLTT